MRGPFASYEKTVFNIFIGLSSKNILCLYGGLLHSMTPVLVGRSLNQLVLM